MAISNNIQKKAEAIEQERIDFPNGPTPIADEVHNKAMNAILGGAVDWVNYMALFSTSLTELARLVPTDGTTDGVRQKARAYLVSNGMCGDGTTQTLADNVSKKLD